MLWVRLDKIQSYHKLIYRYNKNIISKVNKCSEYSYDVYVKERTNNAINIELLNMYLKYDIVSKQDLQEIINTGKLDNIKGIEKFK